MMTREVHRVARFNSVSSPVKLVPWYHVMVQLRRNCMVHEIKLLVTVFARQGKKSSQSTIKAISTSPSIRRSNKPNNTSNRKMIMQRDRSIKMRPSVSVALIMSALFSLSLSTSHAFLPTTTNSLHPRYNSAVCRRLRRNVVDKPQSTTTSPLFLFDGLFTVEKDKDDLVVYKNVGTGSTKYASLAEYVEQWAKFFETDNKLTTPVKVRPLSSETQQEEETMGPNVANPRRGVEIVFQNVPNRGYTDKDATDDDKNNNKKDKKKDKRNVKQGGVAILVEQLKEDDSVQVRAKRCEMDEDTMIKEMSEETILQELKKAIAVWKKGG